MFKIYRFIFLILLAGFINSTNAATDYIPPHAFDHKETIRKELDLYFPDIPYYNYLPSLIEHESCQYLKHKRCWRSNSKLETKKELGVGLGQITKAYDKYGNVRFDSLAGMTHNYPKELADANWVTIQNRPDVQIRMMILMLRDDYKRLYMIPNRYARLQMTDASYNGGLGAVKKSRLKCGLAEDCDPDLWFDNVENHCTKSRRVLYGQRSACDIWLDHVDDVINNRLPKYSRLYFKERD